MQAVRCQQVITIDTETPRDGAGAVTRLNFITAALGNAASAAPFGGDLKFLTNMDYRFAVKAVHRNQLAAIHPKRGRDTARGIPWTDGVRHRTAVTNLRGHHPQARYMIGPASLADRQAEPVTVRDKPPAVPDESCQRGVQYLELRLGETEYALHPGNGHWSFKSQCLILKRPSRRDVSEEALVVAGHMSRRQKTRIEILDRHLEFS